MNKKPKKPTKPDPLRAAAEKKLAPNPKLTLPAGELLHELQVHQIDLEMQNEQLRQAQITLEESRDRYVDLYELAPVGYLTLTATGQIKEANLTCSMLLRMERNKLLHRRFSTFIVPQHRDRWNHAFAIILKQGEAGSCELMIENGDGERFHAQLNCKRREEDGKQTVVRITLTDVSQLRQAEETMREWQQFIDCAHWGMITGRLEDRTIKLANPAFARMHGYTMEELHGLKADKLYAPESRINLPQYAEILRSAGCYTFECVRLRKDGGTFPAVVDVATVNDADGEAIYVASVTDITERKRADESLRKSADEIEDLYNHAPCGYHSLDKDGIIRRINDTELAWLGYTRDEVIGKVRWPDLLMSAGIQFFRKDFPQLIEQGFVRDIEVEIIRKDGTMFNGLINATAIYDASGNFVMSRSTVTDITARKQMERRLRKLHAHLQTVREEEKASIAREIHDDLGGTLTALKMESYRLAEDMSENANAAPFLGHIESMAHLIDDAVNVTRRVITGLRPTILDDFGLQAALEWYAAQFSKRTGIECRVNCIVGEGCEKKLDRVRSINLFRVFQEALTNVLRHSSASHVEVEFHHDGEILLAISDNGCGMKEKCADDPIHYGMLGMTERVEQLGGEIKFGSPPGGGFSVAISLPLPAGDIKTERATKRKI
ncbi:MAG: PAS domain S-box protein [Nitrosomonadales bacterium]|nr:PAS domain S-box protein [Nitrosomonadales bacterium]